MLPPGFSKLPKDQLAACQSRKTSSSTRNQNDPNAALKVKKAWEIAMSPAKSIPMQAMMLWMSGNSVQIFSISIVVMLLYQPIKSILNVKSAFKPFHSDNGRNDALLAPQLTFIALQLVLLGMGMWKCQGLGLLPTSDSDWLAFKESKQYHESVSSSLFP